MIIDSHVHISYFKRKKEFSPARNDLLLNMKRSKIDCSVVIPDNLQNSACADLETVLALVKNESKLFMVGTLKITNINDVVILIRN